MKRTGLLLLLLATGCARTEDSARSLPISIESTADSLSASGRLVAERDPGVPLMARINSVRIECRRTSRSCTESIAMLMTEEDHSPVAGQALYSILGEYEVEAWTDSTIVARSERKVADVTLEIDVANGSAIRRHQETRARGNATADPGFIVTWRLK